MMGAFLSLLLLLLSYGLKESHGAQKSYEFRNKDTLIRGGIVVNADEGESRADVLLRDGKVEALLPSLDTYTIPAEVDVTVVEAKGKYILPGGIDPHTHLDMPFMGQRTCDDYASGHRAALAGGTTLHIDFALPVNGSLLLGYEEWQRKAKVAQMDYAFHMAITQWTSTTAKEMEILVKEKGVNSFKFFLAYKGALMVNDEEFIAGLLECRKLGALAMVHAENGEGVAFGQSHVFNTLGITGPEGHPLSRPAYLEDEATYRAVALAQFLHAPLYVVHVQSKGAMESIARARAEGVRVFGEAVLPGLVVDPDQMWSRNFTWAAAHIMSPPVRGDGEALLKGLVKGKLQLVGTDHAVFNSTQKAKGINDFRIIPNGVNGLEERIPILWNRLVSSGKMKPQDFARITSTKAAKIFNIFPRKGSICAGADADLYILNPMAVDSISAARHHSNLDVNIYENMKAARIDVTIRQGEIVWQNGQLAKSVCDGTATNAGRYIVTPPFSQEVFGGWEAEEERLKSKNKAPVCRGTASSVSPLSLSFN